LEWAYLIDQELPIAIQFQDLYDPIIKLFERGGRIQYHHHELICGRYAWPRNPLHYPRIFEPKDIRDEVLDRIDIPFSRVLINQILS
jgi:hypothetical protein